MRRRAALGLTLVALIATGPNSATTARAGATPAHSVRNGQITFYKSPGEAIEVVQPNGGDRHVLVNLGSCDEHPPPTNGRCRRVWGLSWAPNGESLAYLREGGSADRFRSGLYVTAPSARGGPLEVRRLAWCEGGWCKVAWAPDSTRLALVQNEVLCTLSVKSGRLRRLTQAELGATPSWSPRGDRIAFVRGASLYTIRPDGGHLSQLATFEDPDDEHGLSSPSWSPDGRSLVFSFRDDIYTVNADGTGLRSVRSVPNGAFEPAWSPDGTRILYVAVTEVEGSFTDEVWTVRANGTHPRRVFARRDFVILESIWSPDSRKIAISDDAGFSVENADGSHLRRFANGVIATGGAGEPDLAWQPIP